MGFSQRISRNQIITGS